jgi:hypothetical protein
MDLTTVSTSALQAEIQRRERGVEALQRRRAGLAEALAEVEAELARLGHDVSSGSGAAGAGERAPRARNDISLGDALAQAMEVRAVVTPAEAADLVRANGYQSTSKNFNMIVSNALAKDPRFRRVSRGQYERID